MTYFDQQRDLWRIKIAKNDMGGLERAYGMDILFYRPAIVALAVEMFGMFAIEGDNVADFVRWIGIGNENCCRKKVFLYQEVNLLFCLLFGERNQ